MIKKAEELIDTNDFYKEPVEEIIKEINASKNKKVILTGERECGKTTTLKYLERNHLLTPNIFLFTRFDSIGFINSGIKDLNYEEFYEHYYELILSSKIINFIKIYYQTEYNKYFEDLDQKIITLIHQTDIFIRNNSYQNAKLPRLIKFGSFSNKIIETFIKVCKKESISLLIDRFDWTNSRSNISQITLSKYFNIFDKTVLTTDDTSLETTSLKEKGYDLIEIKYGKDLNIVREIIRRYIENHNKNLRQNRHAFPYEKITDVIIKYLIEQTNGRIKEILATIRETDQLYQWEERNIDIETTLYKTCDYRVERTKELRRVMLKPKLYL